jgi:hypothetical protein
LTLGEVAQLLLDNPDTSDSLHGTLQRIGENGQVQSLPAQAALTLFREWLSD